MDNRPNHYKTLWKQSKRMFRILAFVSSIIILMGLLRINSVYKVLAFFTVIYLVMFIFSKKPITAKKFFLKWFKMMCVVGIIYSLFFYLGVYGIWGLVAMIFIIALWRLFGSKAKIKGFLSSIRLIETMIWGKPLDKEKWKGKPKLKIEWRRRP